MPGSPSSHGKDPMTSHGWLAREQQDDQPESNRHRTARNNPSLEYYERVVF
jgi:hypothetical protein